MATAIDDDPYSWGVEALADFLCNRLAADPTQVRSVLHEEELDGSTFLRYARLAGGDDLHKLFGFTRIKAKLSLLEAVDDLQTASNAYQDWLLKKNGPAAISGSKPSQNGPDIDVPTPQSISKGAFSTAAETTAGEIALASNTTPNGQVPGSPRSEVHSPAYNGSSSELPTAPVPEPASNNASLKRPAPPPGEGEQQPAKKRVMPTLLQDRPTKVNPAFAKPEFISMSSDMEPLSSRAFALTRQPAYLGRGFLVAKEVISHDIPGIFCVTDFGEDSFVAVGSHVPPGRRLVVDKAMRRLLVRNGRREDAMRQGLELPQSEHGSDYDEVLSLVDPTEDFDEQTLREIEEDEAESEAALDRLSPEQVNAILDEFIASREARWIEHKLPKKGRAAWQLWDSTKRHRRDKAIQAQQRLHQLTERIKKIRKDLLEEEWSSRQALLDVARSLEQTIDDRCLHQWQHGILSAREPPPFVAASIQHRLRRTRVEHVAGEGELILSSEDEDDFVVDDAPSRMPMEEDPHLIDPPETMDLTQIETPKKQSNHIIDTIDLTGDTPTKSETNVIEMDKHDGIGGSAEAHVDVQVLKGTNPEDYFPDSKWDGLCSALWKLSHANRMAVFELARKSIEDAWRAMMTCCTTRGTTGSSEGASSVLPGFVETCRLFYMFSKSVFVRETVFHKRLQEQKKKDRLLKTMQKNKNVWWSPFVQFLRKIGPKYPTDAQILNHDQFFAEMGDDSDVEELPDDAELGDHASRRRPAVPSEVVLDQGAADFRDREKAWAEELQARRQRLRARVAAQAVSMPQNSPRLIINEGKKDDEGFICVNDTIAAKIKDHQIDGVRFLWAQIIRDTTERTGGLLAHTMGLGKTMQVITFLVAVQEAARSPDPTISCQIPNDLRKNRTLIVCPASLINNWVDELIIWDSIECLQPLRKIDSQSSPYARAAELDKWATEGGVLVVSYHLVTSMIRQGGPMSQILCNTPNIVVADEAHKMKNLESNTGKACQQFSTRSRIALTGSPLANNVGEYYAMINWVAPGFLGPHEEFQQTYGKIIEQGLYKDSTRSEKKRAIYKLRVLTGTIEPKLHRRTVATLKGELPQKRETVIFLKPTALQEQLYNEWIRVARDCYTGQTMTGFLFTILEILRMICNHPRCLQQKFQAWKDQPKILHEDSPLIVFQQIANKLLVSESDLMSESLSRKTSMVTQLLDEARLMREKVLLFSTSIETLNYLEQLLRSQKRQCARLDGKTAVSKRQAQTKKFNDDSTEVFLISTGAGGVGLNMQGACRVIIFDTKFNPTDEQQAIGRAYRIGQKKPVHVYRFVMAGTFEADVHNRSVFKTQLASRVVDSKNTLTWAARNSQFVHELRDTRNEDLSSFCGKDRILDKLINFDSDRSIKSLVSSDTFEEEDLEDNLTEQDRQAADTMVEEIRKLEPLRLTNKAEYERQRFIIEQSHELRLGADQAAALSQLGHQQTVNAAALALPSQVRPGASAATQPTPNLQTGSRSAPVRSLGPVPAANGISLASFDGAGDNAASNNHDLSVARGREPLDKLNTGPIPPPIMGANTYIGETPRKSVSTTAQSGSQPNPQPSPSSTPFQVSTTEWMWKDNFRKRLEKRCYEVQGADPNAAPRNIEQLASIISHEIQTHLEQRRLEQGHGRLEVGRRWDELQRLLNHDKLVYAVAKGRLTPSFLAVSHSKDLHSRAELFKEMSLVELFKSSPRGEDPKYFEKTRTDLGPAGGRALNRGHSLGDDEVMRTTASRRLQRSESERNGTPDRHDTRLPGWGHKALADHSPRL